METAKQQWAELDGYAVAHGMGYLQDLPLDRFTNFVWWRLTENRDDKDIEALKAKLWQPALGQVVDDPRSPWSQANERKSLQAFKRGVS